MIAPFSPYDREKFIEIARAILKLIVQRSPELTKEAATETAKNFAWEIIEKARDIAEGDSILAELDIDLSEITPRNRKSDNATIKRICAMSEDLLEAVRGNKTLLQSELQVDDDTLTHLMGGLDQFVWATREVLEKGMKRGPDNKTDTTEFIETITVIFKEASGQTFKGINRLPMKERRAWKGQYFNLLEICRFEGSELHSKGAFRKNAERYLEKNDPVRKPG